MTGVEETSINMPRWSSVLCSRELILARPTAPPLHRPDTYTREDASLATEWWCVGSTGWDANGHRYLPCQHRGPGCCFPACTALQPSLLHPLPEFWFDRYENNFKNHTTVYSNPELMALFCLTGKDKETTIPQWPRLK